ncbi:protein FAM136A-like [Hippopotamus amphibius kiboko]|uniref:protein FAM136A-like n=1 Tax=Hippopotamus amphibius kiboko TaxID=575201 RepID=UPI0025965C8C|nr:protein FAM136A-like [Hippopotamus amphibius kiboko]
MAELQQPWVQEAVDSVVKSLERENIQKMQGFMFWCSASCYEDSQACMQQVHQCFELCHAPLAQAQACVTKCVDDHMNLIPTMTKKMKSLSSIRK